MKKAARNAIRRTITALLFPVFFSSLQLRSVSPQQPILIYVDASDSPRKLIHADLSIPVQPGPLTLVYPRWAIPSYELPLSALNNIVGLKMSANGRPIEWNRDLVDMFAFHVTVPDGANVLNVALDVVAPTGRSDLNAATAQLSVLDWYTVVLYPQGAAADALQVKAQLRLPPGWKYACALIPVEKSSHVLEFPQTSLGRLVDSPVLSGKYMNTLAVKSGPGSPFFVHVAGENAAATELSPEWQKRFQRMVAEAGALFGGYPYPQYHFLISVSDEVGNDGLEHRQSSDIRMSLPAFSQQANRLAYGYLLPHEYIHSWNGKYRIPAGMVARTLQETQTTELLWVYEGLTRYLNWVLAARAGILNQQDARDYVALIAAQQSYRSGRDWRSLQDTATSARFLNDAPEAWQSLRRGVDYYDEALLIWLEADMNIRRLSPGKRSLDDFCRAFFRVAANSSQVKPYTFDELVAAMNGVAGYDWKKFFQERLNATGKDRVPLQGLVDSGWNLVYGAPENSVLIARDKVNHTVEERFSLGLLLQEDGTIVDVVRDSPAWKAGLGPGMKVLTVNHRPWSPPVLKAAIAANRRPTPPLMFSVRNGSIRFKAQLAPNGIRYPRLKRNGNPDLMQKILSPLAYGP